MPCCILYSWTGGTVATTRDNHLNMFIKIFIWLNIAKLETNNLLLYLFILLEYFTLQQKAEKLKKQLNAPHTQDYSRDIACCERTSTPSFVSQSREI